MKKSLGQFYTTNYAYILQDMHVPENIPIIEPFAGNGDLVKFIEGPCECYDIDPRHEYMVRKDTLLSPPIYSNKFVITNPPYLARNKSVDKTLFDMYDTNDLYKCFIKTILNDNPVGGIIIIPLNFWCSTRIADVRLRKHFLEKFKVLLINIFEEAVFDDTTYTVCCVQFELAQPDTTLNIVIYPSKKNITIRLYEYSICGELYNLYKNPSISIDRLTTKNFNEEFITNILVKCIDDNTPIGLSYGERYIDTTKNLSARSYATLVISPPISDDVQKILIEKFNKYLTKLREKYHSLFLVNYREGNRKRISFGLVYDIVGYLLNKIPSR
jgi:hypothetical protein